MKELFKKYNIIKTGHFLLTSGRHSNQYIDKDAIYCNPRLFCKVIRNMWSKLALYINRFDIITGPAIAGAVLAGPISYQFVDKIFVYPEKIDGEMVFRRGYNKIIKGKRVWLIEDIITTGSSIDKTIKAVLKCGGKVVGISVIWDRSKFWVPADNNIQFFPLISEYVSSYEPEECPDCQAGKPLMDPKYPAEMIL